jgi:hypothetical protein
MSGLQVRVGPHRESHEPRLDASKFLLDAAPESGFIAWNGTEKIGTKWQMLGNDVYGDCGPCATAHNNMAKADKQIGNTLGRPKYDGVLGTYFAYGTAMGEPGPRPDNGVDNASWLGFLYKEGIIYGYGEVPLDSLDWFASQAHGAICGLVLDGPTAIRDFDQSPKVPWGAMGGQDGHDVLLIATDGQGNGTFVTWGNLQPFTQDFRAQITDAWIIYDARDPKVDHAALQAALADVHGTETPEPVESAPEGVWHKIEDDLEKVEAEIKEAL